MEMEKRASAISREPTVLVDEQDRQVEANPVSAAGFVDQHGVAVAVEGDSRGELTEVIKLPGVDDVHPEATTEVIGQEDASTSDAEDLGDEDPDDDDAGDEIEPPQPLPFVELPEDFDWRKLKPRVYGKSLPPLDPVDLQSLEHSIVSRGILHAILIDELSNIIDGNHRWEICLKKGIVPPVQMVKGLTDEEKEEEALSPNVARRQLKDPEVERQVREARLENMFKGREKNPKKFTLKKIARAIGVSVATVSLRWRERQNSNGEIASMLDARRKYTEAIELEAVRLVEEGMPNADVARTLMMHPKAVQRACSKAKRREAGGAPAKNGKRKKDVAAKPTAAIQDIAESDGVPRGHRPAVQDLGLDAQGYMALVKAERARALEDSKAVADEKHENLKQAVYHAHMAEIFNSRLQPSLSDAGEADAEAPGDSGPDGAEYEVGTVLRGLVTAVEPDDVFVAMPLGGSGVIDKRDPSLTWNAPPDEGEAIRVRVKGFDSKRRLWDLRLQGLQTVAPAGGASAVGPDLDDRCSPDTELADRKSGPKEMGVTQ